MSDSKYTTDDYIRLLYDLEAGLYHAPNVEYHNITREADRSLKIYVRLKDIASTSMDSLEGLIDKAKLLGKLAVHVQKFTAAKISFVDPCNRAPILEHVIIA